ncbi:MAG: hypothetical protein R2838_09820 [Caldilineaceae bacterium]
MADRQRPDGQQQRRADYDGGFSITGGTLVAAGSAGMAQAPDTTSTQNSLLYTLLQLRRLEPWCTSARGRQQSAHLYAHPRLPVHRAPPRLR